MRTAIEARRGFSLLELVVAMAVLLVGIMGFSRSMLSIGRSSQEQHDAALATQAARDVLERIGAESFSEAFRRYDGDPANDPGGAGTAPGEGFAVPGLSAVAGDPDGLPGQVIFPIVSASPGRLREDVVMPDLGMPRDLNGDGVVDANDHSLDYTLLPVLVRVRWRTAGGSGSFELKTMLGGY
jgi:prepilin-type N-terminal cleavage/methylation domain-containing protein